MRITALFTAAAIVLTAAPALAAGQGRVTVRLGDLDLTTPAGAHAAMGRLARAAADVCADGATPALIRMSDAYQRCRADTLASATARIRTPASAAAFDYVQGKTVLLAKR
jgi:UrcA family protein